jgi:hypothetical protein
MGYRNRFPSRTIFVMVAVENASGGYVVIE